MQPLLALFMPLILRAGRWYVRQTRAKADEAEREATNWLDAATERSTRADRVSRWLDLEEAR